MEELDLEPESETKRTRAWNLKEMKKTRDGSREKETFGGMWLIGGSGFNRKSEREEFV